MTGPPGTLDSSAFALSRVRATRITGMPRSARSHPIRRPTADAAPVCSTVMSFQRSTTAIASSPARMTRQAMAVLMSICAPISSPTSSGSATKDRLGTITASLQAPSTEKNATRCPTGSSSAGSSQSPSASMTPHPSKPNMRSARSSFAGVPKLGQCLMASRSW